MVQQNTPNRKYVPVKIEFKADGTSTLNVKVDEQPFTASNIDESIPARDSNAGKTWISRNGYVSFTGSISSTGSTVTNTAPGVSNIVFANVALAGGVGNGLAYTLDIQRPDGQFYTKKITE